VNHGKTTGTTVNHIKTDRGYVNQGKCNSPKIKPETRNQKSETNNHLECKIIKNKKELTSELSLLGHRLPIK
jgi:hypothetical protein